MRTRLRWLRLAVVGGIFVVPMVVMIVAPDTAAVSIEEARLLAPAPNWPMRLDEWVMAIEQSAGAIMRRSRLAKTAEIAAQINTQLRQQGVRFLYMIAPNTAPIETADLPGWALNPGLVSSLYLAQSPARIPVPSDALITNN